MQIRWLLVALAVLLAPAHAQLTAVALPANFQGVPRADAFLGAVQGSDPLNACLNGSQTASDERCNPPPPVLDCPTEQTATLRLWYPTKSSGEHRLHTDRSMMTRSDSTPDTLTREALLTGIPRTGYYALYDRQPAESCFDQMDESAWLRVENDCASEGLPVAGNYELVDGRSVYAIRDGDNTPCGVSVPGMADATNGGCPATERCFQHNASWCCLTRAPVYLGSFLLQADTPGLTLALNSAGDASANADLVSTNMVVMTHLCGDYFARDMAGVGQFDGGSFFSDDRCSWNSTSKALNSDGSYVSPNSVHLSANELRICTGPERYQPCGGGCADGECLPGFCESVAPSSAFGQQQHQMCRNAGQWCSEPEGACVDTDPCANSECDFGCRHGQCLHEPTAPGPDADLDGYSVMADCDDGDARIWPGSVEVCSDGRDNNCNGETDERPCMGQGGAILPPLVCACDAWYEIVEQSSQGTVAFDRPDRSTGLFTYRHDSLLADPCFDDSFTYRFVSRRDVGQLEVASEPARVHLRFDDTLDSTAPGCVTADEDTSDGGTGTGVLVGGIVAGGLVLALVAAAAVHRKRIALALPEAMFSSPDAAANDNPLYNDPNKGGDNPLYERKSQAGSPLKRLSVFFGVGGGSGGAAAAAAAAADARLRAPSDARAMAPTDGSGVVSPRSGSMMSGGSSRSTTLTLGNGGSQIVGRSLE